MSEIADIAMLLRQQELRWERAFMTELQHRYAGLIRHFESSDLDTIDWALIMNRYPELRPIIDVLLRHRGQPRDAS